MTARPCSVCRALGLRRPTPGCGWCREAAARRVPRLTPDHIFLARLQRLTWIPLTPLQRYRARMARLAEIAAECGLGIISKALASRVAVPLRHITADDAAWLRESVATWPAGTGRAAAWLLLSAADETAALLATTPKDPR